jgi:hypothetical protein
MLAGALASGAAGTGSSALPVAAGSGAAVDGKTSAATAQVAAVLVGTGPIPAGDAGSAGGSRLTIVMAPPAIGAVTVQIDTIATGGAAVSIGATHPATLAALQGDHAALAQMLTQAGVAVDHRSVSFHLEPVHQDATGAGAGGGAAWSGMGQGGSGQAGGQGFQSQSGARTLAQAETLVGGGAMGQGTADRRGASGAFGPGGEAAQGYDRQGAASSAAVIAAGAVGAGSGLQRFGLDVIA